MSYEDKFYFKIKKILNNNVVISQDKNDKEVIITGQGIGFNKRINSYIDPANIYKIYDLRSNGFRRRFELLLNQIPFDCIRLTEQLIDYAKNTLNSNLNQNLVISLADHINFAILQHKNGIIPPLNMNAEIKRLYRKEYEVAKEIVKVIDSHYNVTLSENEVSSIAFHLINAELNGNTDETTKVIKITAMPHHSTE